MKVLVTGSEGFIGSHLVKYLENNQIDVVTLDTAPSGRVGHLHCRLGCLLTHEREELFKTLQECKVVIHLAAYDGLLPSDLLNTIAGTEELFSFCKGLEGVEKIILFSDYEVGGGRGPLDEKFTYACQSVYAATKAAQEILALAYIEQGLPISIVRSVNVFGSNQKNAFIPDIVRELLNDDCLSVTNEIREWVSVEHVCNFLNYVAVASFIPPKTILHITGTEGIAGALLARSIIGYLEKPYHRLKEVVASDKKYSLIRGDATEHFGCPKYESIKFDSDLLKTCHELVKEFEE